MSNRQRFGAIEAGGTKFMLGVFDHTQTCIERAQIPTTTPIETINRSLDWFSQFSPFQAFGIASFGPCDLTRGLITHTPKEGWSGTQMVQPFTDTFGCPTGFETDVTAAALAELELGTAKGLRSAVYVTVGTGIGGGYAGIGADTNLLHHAEMGHIRVERHPHDTDFKGICPFHKDCLEGLASGPAIRHRWGASLSDLTTDTLGIPSGCAHPTEIISHYLGQLAVNIQSISAPDCLIFGGGVMQAPGLLSALRQKATLFNQDYLPVTFHTHIRAPALGQTAGLSGAALLAYRAGL